MFVADGSDLAAQMVNVKANGASFQKDVEDHTGESMSYLAYEVDRPVKNNLAYEMYMSKV